MTENFGSASACDVLTCLQYLLGHVCPLQYPHHLACFQSWRSPSCSAFLHHPAVAASVLHQKSKTIQNSSSYHPASCLMPQNDLIENKITSLFIASSSALKIPPGARQFCWLFERFWERATRSQLRKNITEKEKGKGYLEKEIPKMMLWQRMWEHGIWTIFCGVGGRVINIIRWHALRGVLIG